MNLTQKHLFKAVLLLSVLALLFTGCKFTYKYSGIEQLHIAVSSEEELSQLDEYPDLTQLDLTGSTLDYDIIGEWAAIHPWIDILHTVPMGDQTVLSNVTELALENDSCSFEELMKNLDYLPELTSLSLHNTSLTTEQIAALIDEYDDVEVTYTADLLGQTLDGNSQQLDLSALTSADVQTAARQLQMFSALTDVELMDAQGESRLTLEDVKLLMEANPGVTFHYTFDLFGKTVSAADTSIEFTDVSIGNSGVEQLRQALEIMSRCTYLKLDNCGIDNEIMAELQEDFSDMEVVWRVFIGNQSLMTDAETLYITYAINDENSDVLRYCPGIKYVDISRSGVTDLSFTAYMPELEALVLTSTRISDLSPLAGCTKLEWLELVGCSQVTDLSPLRDLPNLKYLNVSGTGVSDLSALENLPLQSLMCLNNRISADMKTTTEESHPDCLVRFGTGVATGYGWRYSDYSFTKSEYYEKLCKIFGY